MYCINLAFIQNQNDACWQMQHQNLFLVIMSKNKPVQPLKSGFEKGHKQHHHWIYGPEIPVPTCGKIFLTGGWGQGRRGASTEKTGVAVLDTAASSCFQEPQCRAQVSMSERQRGVRNKSVTNSRRNTKVRDKGGGEGATRHWSSTPVYGGDHGETGGYSVKECVLWRISMLEQFYHEGQFYQEGTSLLDKNFIM